MSLAILACEKVDKSVHEKDFVTKGTEPEPEPVEVEFECEYIIEPASAPILSMLTGYTDPKEEQLDQYIYHLAKAISRYTCTGGLEGLFNVSSFSRYSSPNPVELEAEIEVMMATDPDLDALIRHEFASAGLDWDVVKNDFDWQGFNYTPTLYFENAAVADWALDPFIGIGTDVSHSLDAVADFVPFFQNDCQEEPYDPNEIVIGKVNGLNGVDTVVNFESTCIYNPIFIVQLSWNQSITDKSLTSTTIPTPWLGDIKDTIIPAAPPAGPNCDLAKHYYLTRVDMGCERFERSKYSELEVAYFTLPTNLGTSYYPYGSVEEELKDVHKNDKCKDHNMKHEFLSIQRDPGITPLPIGKGTGLAHNLYAITYEYDWYSTWRGWRFPDDQGITVRVGMKRKGGHEHYQIIVVKPTDWCDYEMKEYRSPRGESDILAKENI